MYTRLFGLSDFEEMQRKKQPLGAAGFQDMFEGSSQHQDAMGAAAQESAKTQQAFQGIGAAGTQWALGSEPVTPAAGEIVGANMPPGSPPEDRPELYPATPEPAPAPAPETGLFGDSEPIYKSSLNPRPSETSPYALGNQFVSPMKREQSKGYLFGGFRRYGGPMYPGYEYIVGEDGPEKVQIGPDGKPKVVPLVPDVNIHSPARAEERPDTDVAASGPDYTASYIASERMPKAMWGMRADRMNAISSIDPKIPDSVKAKPPNLEINPYKSGEAREALPDDADPLTRSRYEVDSLLRAGPQKERSVWKRIGRGVLAGLQAWGQAGGPGGLGGALGSIATGGTMFGVSKTAEADARFKEKLGKLFGQYQMAAAPQMADMEMKKAQLGITGQALDITKKRQDIRLDPYKEARQDPIFKKDIISEADMEYINQTYDVQMRNPDNPQFEEMEVGGYRWIRRKGQTDWVKNTSAPIDRAKLTQPFTIDGVTGDLTGPQAVGTMERLKTGEVANKYRQEAITFREKQAQYSQQKDAEDRAWKRHVFEIEQSNKKVDQQLARARLEIARTPKGATQSAAYQEMEGLKGTMDALWLDINTPGEGKNNAYYEKKRAAYHATHELYRKAYGKYLSATGRSDHDPLELEQ